MSPTKPKRIRATSDAAIIEVYCFDDRPSLTESTFKPLCLNVAVIHSIQPFSATYCPGAKTRLYLRKGSGGRSDERLELREDYATVKQLIRAAQKEGFAEVQL
jgi:hypothetical protein